VVAPQISAVRQKTTLHDGPSEIPWLMDSLSTESFYET
jgi:hypothetical protein